MGTLVLGLVKDGREACPQSLYNDELGKTKHCFLLIHPKTPAPASFCCFRFPLDFEFVFALLLPLPPFCLHYLKIRPTCSCQRLKSENYPGWNCDLISKWVDALNLNFHVNGHEDVEFLDALA